MPVTRTKVDISEERRVISHMITSTALLSRLKGIGEARLFESAFARTAATWVWEYYDLTSEAPGKGLEDIYHRKSRDLQDEDREMVAEFLSSLSADWERAVPNNVDFAFDTALQYFKVRALSRLVDQLQSSINDRNPARGEQSVAEFTRPEKAGGSAVDMFRDAGAVTDAFSSEEEQLFKLTGAVGQVMGTFIREDFVAFLAPPKRGKTWWLILVAITAALCGKKVLFISLEMSQRQMVRRFWQALSGTSRNGEEAMWSTFEENGDKWEIVSEMKPTRRTDSDSKSIEKLQSHLRKASRGGELLLENYPTGSFSVKDLKTRVSNLALYQNTELDVIVVDYADIMDHGPGNEERQRLNRTWTGLRGLASECKVALFSASQSGRGTVTGKKDADESDIAEDIRKLAHVTKLIKINQNKDDKKRGLFRISCDTQREGASQNDQAWVTSCLAIGRPCLDSRFGAKVIEPEDSRS